MLLPIKTSSFFVITLLFIFSRSLAGQDTNCSLSPPVEVTTSGTADSYSLSWPENINAQGYKVIVVDMASGDLMFSAVRGIPTITIENVPLNIDSYIGIASLCDHGEEGAYGYFPYESTTTINVQDIVMQMAGEDGPRTLECDAEKLQIKSVNFTGGINTVAHINPPFNASTNYPVEGAIVEISLYEQSSGSLFAKATMLNLSNNVVHNADDQSNVTSLGAFYDFVNPAGQHFFDYTIPANGQFEYFINTTAPGAGGYQLLVEQRNCFNVNKIRKKNDNAGLNSATTSNRLSQQTKIQSVVDGDLYLYPNPASHQIQLSRSTENVVVRNDLGQVIYQMDFLAGAEVIQISAWPQGVYYLETTAANGTREVVRFVKS